MFKKSDSNDKCEPFKYKLLEKRVQKNKIIPNKKKIKAVSIQSDHAHLCLSVFSFLAIFSISQ